jgi:pyruvate/2-oxoglutarate dehydrogenase complex dihydrolipoamide dehydrogenase (E3) component
MTTEQFDAVIIGSGQGGNPLARALVAAGRKTALIEREHIGGTCVNEGCTPTKTMVASARVAYLARRGADYGALSDNLRIDLGKVRERKRTIVDDFRSSGERGLEQAGVTVFAGEGRFTSEHEIVIALNNGETKHIRGAQIVINTGARPANPPIPGLDDVPFLDSTSIMELDQVPEHLIVIGGGYIGLEFGQMFRRFGSAVTIVQRGKQLLGREDEDMASAVADILRQDGIDVLLTSEPQRLTRDGAAIVLSIKTPAGERELRGSHLLLAVGRKPNTDTLNLDAAGVATDKQGNVVVNERLQTYVPHIYAIGDVKGGPAFTHISYDDFRILRRNLLEDGDATTAGRMVPYTAFIDPQFARVGLNEQEARAQGIAFKVAKMPMEYVARALEMDESRGLMKAIVDAQSEQILGFTVLGVEGGELMSAVQIAMMGKLSYTALRDAIFAHPTIAECLNNLFATVE